MSFSCLNPLVAVSYGKIGGKHKLKFMSNTRYNYNLFELKRQFGEENVFLMPCGKCEACRRNYAENWAVRCTLEAMQHKYNYFLTLTYDDAHLIYASKDDLDKFFDRLEGKGHKRKVIYFISREYGELTGRCHYHAILFMDDELTLIDPCKLNGNMFYHSPEISKAWDFGLHNIARFESNCARYVAKYTNKEGNKVWMSRNIGKSYVKEHYKEIVADGFKLYGDFGSKNVINVPTSIMRWILEDDSDLSALADASVNREELKALGHAVAAERLRNIGSSHEELLTVNDRCVSSKTKKKVRKL